MNDQPRISSAYFEASVFHGFFKEIAVSFLHNKMYCLTMSSTRCRLRVDIVAWCVKLLLVISASHVITGSCPGYSILVQLPWFAPGKAVEDGLHACLPASCMRNPDEAPGSFIWPGTILVMEAIWEWISAWQISLSVLYFICVSLTFK